jgi:RNase P subunit RPR2
VSAPEAALLGLLAGQPSLACGACATLLRPRLDRLDQSGKPIDAVSWDCLCGWKRTVKLEVKPCRPD